MEHASQNEHDVDGALASPQTAYHCASPVGNLSVATPQASVSVTTAATEPQYTRLDGHAVVVNVLDPFAKYRWYQTWNTLRWKLARNVFAKPLPMLTAHLELKLGDLLVTLPVAAALLAVSAVELADLQTKSVGGPAQIALGLTIVLPVRNNSLLLALTGLSFERAIFYHKLFGVVALATSSMHALSYVLKHHRVYGASAASAHTVFTGDKFDDASASAAVSGAVAYVPLAVLVVLSAAVVRRRCFEFFWRMHWLLFVAVVVGAALHGITLALIAAALWGVDALYRLVYRTRVYAHGAFIQQTPAAVAPTSVDTVAQVGSPQRPLGVVAADQVTATKITADVVRIAFPRVRVATGERFDYDAGQFAFVCVPALSPIEWHPFSLSSSPHEALVTLHVKVRGDWTRKLLALAADDAAAAPNTPLAIRLDGPYGRVALDLASPTLYSHVVLIGGGIGITPLRSIVNALYDAYSHGQYTTLQHVHLVWSVRDRALLEALVATDDADAQHASAATTTYFPHALAATASSSVFTTEIFLTQTERDVEQSVVPPAIERTCMRYNTRPNVSAILRTVVGTNALQHKQQRVAVLVCGPAALTRDVVEASRCFGNELHVHFDVHTETFEL